MSVRAAWLVVALFAALSLWFLLGTVGTLVDRELAPFTDQTVAPAVRYQP